MSRETLENEAKQTTGRGTITEWADISYEISKDHGFHDPGMQTIWTMLGNIHGEVSEAWEEARKADYVPERNLYWKDDKPLGLSIELADILIRVLDTSKALGIDLEYAVALKTAYNSGRPRKHGGKRI